jgi:hypothetical protein
VILWTDDLRRDLAPRDASKLKHADPKKAWTSVHVAFPQASSDALKKGLDEPGADRASMELALATLRSREMPSNATPQALGAALCVANHTARAETLASAIVETHGVVFLANALVCGHALTFKRTYPKHSLVAMHASAPFAWRALRAGVLQHGEVEVTRVAREAWPEAGLSLKTVFAHALSGAPDLAADVARDVAALPSGTRVVVAPILVSLRDDTHLFEALRRRAGAQPLVDAVENFRLSALPTFVKLWSFKINDRVHLARATSCFDDESAAAVLARELDKKSTRLIARAYLLQASHAGEALREAAKGRSKLATLAAELLTQTTRAATAYEEAPLPDLPRVLSAPPWIVGKPKRAIKVVSVSPHDRDETDCTTPERREVHRAQTIFDQMGEMDADAVAQYVAKVKTGESGFVWWVNHKRIPKEILRELITTVGYIAAGSSMAYASFAIQAVAVFGQPAVRPLVDYLEREWQAWPRFASFLLNMELDCTIDSHRFAALLLDVVDDVRFQSREWQYFDDHLEATLVGILPVAVGKRCARRTAAERVLRRLAVRHVDAIRSAAASYGEDAATSVAEILAVDARDESPKAAPRMPSTWRPSSFTRPLLRDGRALPLEAVDRIGHMLAFSTLEAQYAGLADVKAVCDLRSLAELAWDAARTWEAAGGKMADAWMIESIAHLGDDEIMRRTTPAIAHPHIVTVLAHAATDAAATELCTIAWRAKQQKASRRGTFAHRRSAAAIDAAFRVLARKRRMTVEQVEDSLAPTIAITGTPLSARLASLHTTGDHARIALDYGSRTIHVGFDERLDPFVESDRGKLRELPKAGKKDDPEKVAQAQAVWRELQEDVTAIADLRLTSLERAMSKGRGWSIEAFRHAWMDHPLMRQLARGVVWRAPQATFRITEDGTFADVRDAHVSIAGPITVPHPAEMSVEECEAWQRVFLDYRITQPLDQLSRSVLRTASGDTLVLAPVVPQPLPDFHKMLDVAGFEKGWRNRLQIASRRCARGSAHLIGTLGVENKMVTRVTWSAEVAGQPVDLAQVHPVDLSELVADLALEQAQVG